MARIDAATRLQRRQLSNVRVLGGDVFRGLTELIQPDRFQPCMCTFPILVEGGDTDNDASSIAGVYRLVCDRTSARRIAPPWTDVEEYFGVISSLMEQDPARLLRRYQHLRERPPTVEIWITTPASGTQSTESRELICYRGALATR
ncbi:MAG: hypothetical protein R3C02_10140 [Planctomycetaceae bacterium]